MSVVCASGDGTAFTLRLRIIDYVLFVFDDGDGSVPPLPDSLGQHQSCPAGGLHFLRGVA